MPARSATNRILDIFDGIGAVFAAASLAVASEGGRV